MKLPECFLGRVTNYDGRRILVESEYIDFPLSFFDPSDSAVVCFRPIFEAFIEACDLSVMKERERIWKLVRNSQLDGPGWADLEQAIFPERKQSELGNWIRESEA